MVRNQYPPPETYRKRLCVRCKDDLEAEGYLTNYEAGTCLRGTCERCGAEKTITEVYRYTLTARERKRRGLD